MKIIVNKLLKDLRDIVRESGISTGHWENDNHEYAWNYLESMEYYAKEYNIEYDEDLFAYMEYGEVEDDFDDDYGMCNLADRKAFCIEEKLIKEIEKQLYKVM